MRIVRIYVSYVCMRTADHACAHVNAGGRRMIVNACGGMHSVGWHAYDNKLIIITVNNWLTDCSNACIIILQCGLMVGS